MTEKSQQTKDKRKRDGPVVKAPVTALCTAESRRIVNADGEQHGRSVIAESRVSNANNIPRQEVGGVTAAGGL